LNDGADEMSALSTSVSPFGPAFGDVFGGHTSFGFDIPQGDPGAIESAASDARRLASAFDDQAHSLQTASRVAIDGDGGWRGSASAAYAEYSGHMIGVLTSNSAVCERVAGALSQFGRQLSHAQSVTRQALAECERYSTAITTQQTLAQAAARAETTANQNAAVAVHPAAADAYNRQATQAHSDMVTAQNAASTAQGNLDDATRRGRDAYEAYTHEASAINARLQGAAAELRPAPALPGGGARVPVTITPADASVAASAASMFASGCVLGPPINAVPPAERTPGVMLALAMDVQAQRRGKNGSSQTGTGTGPAGGSPGHGSGPSLSPSIGAPLLLSGVGMAATGGAKTGVSGVASFAGRTLRTGDTPAARSAAARLLPKAGGLAKDLEPYARGALVAGTAVDIVTSVAEGHSAGETIVHAGASGGAAIAAGVVVGGVCEAGTLGVGTVGCVVLGGVAAGGASAAGGYVADHFLQPVSHGIDDGIHWVGSLIP
jgi:hypothetical protein